MANVLMKSIGLPIDRFEGHAKVTGSATYAADYHLKNLAYGVMVTSTIAKGKILELNTKAAENASGVVAVVSHLNLPEVPGYHKGANNKNGLFRGQEFRPFYDNEIYFNHQPVALVIADTLEEAQYAASLVKLHYQEEDHCTDIYQNLSKAYTPHHSSDYQRGETDAWKNAPVNIEQEYATPIQVHNPMEPHATTAYWNADGSLIILNKSQAVKLTQQTYAHLFDLDNNNIKVNSPFVGGAFGSASKAWPHEVAAVIGAKKVGRPVQVALQRDQVFNMVGYRPHSVQKIAIGAEKDGTLRGIYHHAYDSTSSYEQFTERITEPTKTLYDCANLQTVYKLVPLDMSTPCPARGPGETSGSFALESAMDELSYALNMDPLELRMKNFAEKNLENNLPWSSNYLKECYQTGAEKFGWHKRNPKPRSMLENGMLTGMGMSAGIYKAERATAEASIKMDNDGNAMVKTSVADTGPGSATIMTQIAADALGVDVKRVKIQWGNTTLPTAPGQFGSQTTASTGSAVHDAAIALKEKFISLSKKTNSSEEINYTEILKQQNLPELEVSKESHSSPENEKYSGKSFAAHFVKVHVHPATGEVRMQKVVSAIDCGTIINHKTAHSQMLGAVAWGIGIALMEEGILDHRYGCYVNNNLAYYHVPVNADIPPIEVHFIDKPDKILDPMGAKGLGEIGLVGFTAAIANAVFHATGKRVRKLPITPDKLIS